MKPPGSKIEMDTSRVLRDHMSKKASAAEPPEVSSYYQAPAQEIDTRSEYEKIAHISRYNAILTKKSRR